MAEAVLTFNAGSSSLKFALADVAAGRRPIMIAVGQIESIGVAPHLIVHDRDGAILLEQRWGNADLPYETLMTKLLDWAQSHIGTSRLVAISHRIVHGGSDFTAPVRIDEMVLTRLDRLCPLAPLHQPHALAAARTALRLRPGLPQIACFDTAFHATMPALATRFGIPHALTIAGVRRYGFHGLSYEYIANRLAELDPRLAKGRVIAAHLGAGASLCALRDGRSIDTTMGFTALEGLVMGTRCGAIDPGVILYLLQEKGLSADDIQHLLYEQSGLLGVSGISGDMRTLLASEAPLARDAIDLFVYRIAREAGALVGMLGGVDGLVFTAGIGEHIPEIRAAVCDRLAWLGVVLDVDANRRNLPIISAATSRVQVRVIPTDEEAMLAEHGFALIQPPAGVCA